MAQTPDPDVLAAALSDLANALQAAGPTAARLHERADAIAQDAERLLVAVERATAAVRRLQPAPERQP